jgi:hypothetical protein
VRKVREGKQHIELSLGLGFGKGQVQQIKTCFELKAYIHRDFSI